MYLISGSSSGLGKYLSANLPAVKFLRDESLETYRGEHFNAIIHCAYNAVRDIHSTEFHQYVRDNFLLTQSLLGLNYDKFIFISSSDVYPTDLSKRWCENDEFVVDPNNGLYSVSKLMTESLVSSTAKNHLIIRPTALLGLEARPNSLIKMLTQSNVSLTLSGSSTFNYVLYEDMLSFIMTAMKRDTVGIFNAASNDNLMLGDIANQLGVSVNFGEFTYQGRLISNEKIKMVAPVFDRRSIDVVNQFTLILGRSVVC